MADPGNGIVLSVVAALDVLGLPSPTDDVLRDRPAERVAAGADLMVDSVESLRSALDRAVGLVGRVAR